MFQEFKLTRIFGFYDLEYDNSLNCLSGEKKSVCIMCELSYLGQRELSSW